MRIYFAGKINPTKCMVDPGWRQEFLGRKDEWNDLEIDGEYIPGIIYGGPLGISGLHGMNLSDHKNDIWKEDVKLIKDCDIVYARLELTNI